MKLVMLFASLAIAGPVFASPYPEDRPTQSRPQDAAPEQLAELATLNGEGCFGRNRGAWATVEGGDVGGAMSNRKGANSDINKAWTELACTED